jgi:hypothetical protein
MGKISTYPDISTPTLSDKLIGTDETNSGITKNFPISSILGLINVSSYVPYTGATADVDLGTYKLSAKSLKITGSGNNGFLGLNHQTTTPTPAVNESALFADANGDISWQNDTFFSTTIRTSSNTNNRTYVLPDASGTVALTSNIPSITPSALTKTDDTNVTLTLGGSPSTALLQGVSLTLGWTGTLADSRIASAATWNAKQTAYTILTTLGSLANASGVLQNNGSGVLSYVSALSNPMTTQGDMIYAGVSGIATRLALGTTGYILQSGATVPTWFNLFGTSNSFSLNQNFTVTPVAGGDLTNIAATFGSITGSGTIRVGQYLYLTSQLSGSFQGIGITTTDSTGTIWLSNGSIGGNNVIVNLGGSTGSGAATGGIINGVKGFTTYNGVATFDNIATNAGNSMKFRSKNTSSTQLDRLVIDGWATTAPINMINSVVNIGGTSIITANSTLQVSGSFAQTIATKSASYTLTASDYSIVFTGSTAAQTMTLPTAVSITGRIYEIVNAGTVSITIATTASETFLNVATTPTSLTLSANAAKSVRVQSTGTAWVQLN